MSKTHNEIMDTPNALRKTIDYLHRQWPSISGFLNGRKRFAFLGCGSSYSLARSASIMFQMRTGLPSAVLPAGDLLLHAPRYERILSGAAVICISRSGQTSEMLMALDSIKHFGIAALAMICVEGTPLEERCELSLNMPWAFDDSVCQTRTVTNFYFTYTYIMAKYLGDQTLLDDLRHIADCSGDFLQVAEKLSGEIAARPWNHCVVVADAELEGIADEGALAFKEICQLPSNYYHILDARHGPMVLIGEQTLLLAAVDGDALELGFLSEMKDKGALAVAFSDMPLDAPGIISLPYGRKLTHIARGIPFIMMCQMISLRKAAYTGADPDRPSGLDAWISLES